MGNIKFNEIHMIPLLDIHRRYHESHRHYHTFEHLIQMFSFAKEHNIMLDDDLKLAIYYHDAVYRIGNKTNEEESVELFRLSYKDNPAFSRSRINFISELIMDTKHHNKPITEEGKLIADLDLSCLSTFGGYVTTSTLVYKEYSQRYTDEDFIKGRKKFLQRMLNRKVLFYTEKFKVYESKLREFITMELELLNTGKIYR